MKKIIRHSYLADEILDRISLLEERSRPGCHQCETAAETERLSALRQVRQSIAKAVRLALSPLTAAAAAEIADSERAGMQQARALVVLPDFLTWIEWRDAACGVPGQRFGLLLQAVEDEAGPSDAEGLLFALPADGERSRDDSAQTPMLTFALRLKSVELPLLEFSLMSPAMGSTDELDANRLGRFLVATLTFISRPRIAEQADAGNDLGRHTERASAAERPNPQMTMREVRLIIDLPGEVKAAAGTEDGRVAGHGGGAPGGMPWHRVRMFWRWRLGRLEVVRPHARGSIENGISRHVTLLLHPSESTARRLKTVQQG